MINDKRLTQIERSLLDLEEICSKHNIEYRVIGSTAIIGANDSVHRIPADVDVLFDQNKKDLLYRELGRLGYKKESQDFPLNILPEKLERFVKGKQIIEPRGGKFKDNYLEYQLLLPIAFSLKIKARLVFTPSMGEGKRYTIGKANFMGLSKEALFVSLTSFMEVIEALKDKTQKRQLDLKVLSKGLNQARLKRIIDEEPGIYLRNIPLITTKKKLLIKLIMYFLNLKKI